MRTQTPASDNDGGACVSVTGKVDFVEVVIADTAGGSSADCEASDVFDGELAYLSFLDLISPKLLILLKTM